jgi:hypothetical protein
MDLIILVEYFISLMQHNCIKNKSKLLLQLQNIIFASFQITKRLLYAAQMVSILV